MEVASVAAAVEVLASQGLAVAIEDLELREHRWLARAGPHLIWLAADAIGQRELQRESVVLGSVQGVIGVDVPEVIEEFLEGQGQVRRAVPGLVDHASVRRAALADGELAQRVGGQIGRVLARLHEIPLPRGIQSEVSWPEPSSWIRARLPDVVADASLIARIDAALAQFDDVAVPAGDLVLAHADIGYHNMVFDPSSLDLVGLFDFGGAALADRHWDLCDLVYEGRLAEAAFAAYMREASADIDERRLHLYNAARAFSYLAFREGVDPERVWCGRTLEQDLSWCELALCRASL